MTSSVLAAPEIQIQPRTPIAIAAIPVDFLIRARIGIDALGQKVKRIEAEGGEPLRDVLRRARPGERLILASFSPFALPGPFHEFGPIYVLESASREPVDRHRLPQAGSASDYLRDQFVIRAYSAEEEILDAALTPAREFAATVDRFLDRPSTAFLHVRFPTYGCFALRIDRA